MAGEVDMARVEAPARTRFSITHIPELDGFRAIAISMVFVMHMFYGWNPRPPVGFHIPRAVLLVIGHGWLGVDLFFILSGFLITGILLDSKESANYFRNFYARRVLRIIPIYYLCITIMLLAYRHPVSYFGLSFGFLANFHHAFHIAPPHGPSTFWSLAIEEHFYLMWPLLVRYVNRSTLLRVTLFLVFGTPIVRAICYHMGMNPELAIYEYSWCRFDGLALGAIMALYVRSKYFDRKTTWQLAGFLCGFALLTFVIGIPFGILDSKSMIGTALHYTEAQFVFAAAIVLSLFYRGTSYTGILRTRVGKFIAGISYCLYLIHVAIGEGYYWVLHRFGFNDAAHFGSQGAVFVRLVVIGIVAFSLAAFSKRFVEDPILQLKRSF